MVCCKQRASLEQTTGHTAPSKNSWNSVYCTARVRNSRNDVSPRAVTYPSISTPLPCVVHRARGEASLAGCARVLGGGDTDTACPPLSFHHSAESLAGAAPKGARTAVGTRWRDDTRGCCFVVVGAMCQGTKKGGCWEATTAAAAITPGRRFPLPVEPPATTRSA